IPLFSGSFCSFDCQSREKEMKRVQQEMHHKIDEIETKAEERHKEILDQLTAFKHDQDFIWEKTVRHEREIHAIKMKLS
ncbi:hypothetical protein LIZ98_17765, partial [Caldibacillus sp. 210928-DFI.2.18]|nr:hypothetical protein [Caldibacillus sp. 210928-DFI.2.18]